MKKILIVAFLAVCAGMNSTVVAEELIVQMHMLTDKGTGRKIGTVKLQDTEFGLLLTPQLAQLPPGLHGFHVHQNPDCSSAMKNGKLTPGQAAGGHYDPAGTNRHEGPYGKGHLGDLPALYVNPDGKAVLPLLAPRLKTADVQERSLVVHEGGDTYSDKPELGGGGARIACGVVK